MSEATEIMPEDLQAHNPLVPIPHAEITIEPYGNRFWAVHEGDQLLCVWV